LSSVYEDLLVEDCFGKSNDFKDRRFWLKEEAEVCSEGVNETSEEVVVCAKDSGVLIA